MKKYYYFCFITCITVYCMLTLYDTVTIVISYDISIVITIVLIDIQMEVYLVCFIYGLSMKSLSVRWSSCSEIDTPLRSNLP